MGRKIIDLSQPIFTGAQVFPGHPQTVITVTDTYESTAPRFTGGMSYMAEKIEMSTHGTTHTDSVMHIDPSPGAPAIDELPLDLFYGPGICLDLSHVPPQTEYTVEMIKEALAKAGLDIRKGDTVLIYSGHYVRTYGTPAYLTDYPGLGREAAEFIYGQGVMNIGQDAPSHDRAGQKVMPAHHVCREMKTLNTENLGDLRPVAGKRFLYAGFPLRILHGSGSPIRAVAIFEEDDPA